jgi:hypothetical protein
VIGPAIRAGLIRTGLVAGIFTLSALAVGHMPVPGAIRAAGMLALPCVLFSVLRREARRIAKAADQFRERSVRPPAPAAQVRRRR